MTKLKYGILFIILVMTVGVAAVSTNLIINGSTPIASNSDDFNVYFSNVLVNGTQDLSLVQSETSLVFTGEFSAVGDKKEITYDVTNASKNYDADIDISCTQSTEYLTISNVFDTDTYLSATSTRTGILTISLSKSYTGTDLTQDITCTITASAVERTSQGSGVVADAVDPYYVGKEIMIGSDMFNVISSDATTVTMLAKYGLGYGNRQSLDFSICGGISGTVDECAIGDGIMDLDIQQYHGDITSMLNSYVDYLSELTEDETIIGDLLSLGQLSDLGCTVPSDYNYGDGGWTCNSSPYKSWLSISASEYPFFLMKSVVLDQSTDSYGPVWTLNANGDLGVYNTCGLDGNLRPTITISRDTLEKFNYTLGDEVTIGNENFNVLSDNGNTVSMLAQYNISEMDCWQSEDEWPLFYNSQIEDGSERYVADYANGLSFYLGVSDIGWKLPSVADLVNLRCLVPDTGIYYGVETCIDSPYKDWLINGQNWWTSSTIYDTKQWGVLSSGDLFEAEIYESKLGARPVITIPKEVLEKDIISFTIKGDIYFAENGMTWGEWVVSKYNVTENIKNIDGFVCLDDVILGQSNLNFVHVGDSILVNHAYTSSGVSYS